MLFVIKSNSTTALPHPFQDGNIIVLRFSDFALSSKSPATHNILQLKDEDGNTVMGVEQSGDNPFVAVVAGEAEEKQAINWPERYPNKDDCNHSIAVYDHGTHYEVLFDVRSAFMIEKPEGKPTKVYAEWTKDHGASAKLEIWESMYNFLNHSDCNE